MREEGLKQRSPEAGETLLREVFTSDDEPTEGLTLYPLCLSLLTNKCKMGTFWFEDLFLNIFKIAVFLKLLQCLG